MNELKHSYSNAISNKNILIVGPDPPPNGGVEVHIKRIKIKLEQQNNHVSIFDTSKIMGSPIKTFLQLSKKLVCTRPDIIHLHEPTLSRIRLFVSCIWKHVLRYQLVTIDHNCTELYEQSPLHKKLFGFLMRIADHVVVIGNTAHKCYLNNAVLVTSTLSVESPFLPPPLTQAQAILNLHPQSVCTFIHERSPLLTANAFELSFLQNKDLYGLNVCIDLIEKLKTKYPNIGLVFALATNRNPEYLEQIRILIKEKNLESNVYIHMSTQEFWPIIQQSDLFLRPTQTDTFGISVQEAIVLGVPAIASNVCIRPEKTILYSLNNFAELTDKALSVLQNWEKLCKTSISSSCAAEAELVSGHSAERTGQNNSSRS